MNSSLKEFEKWIVSEMKRANKSRDLIELFYKDVLFIIHEYKKLPVED